MRNRVCDTQLRMVGFAALVKEFCTIGRKSFGSRSPRGVR